MDFESEPAGEDLPEVRQLTKAQRRVLGVLVEKAYTVPESYPLTLKAVTSGCNQKSNRAPITNYTEDAVLAALDELRELRLIAVVHTESGRTERYRHYVRKRFPFTEPQLAVLAELWLRGRQQVGELRARASRMTAIDSLEDLKRELEGLLQEGYLQADGPLDRRGVEVDHGFYPPQEQATMTSRPAASRPADAEAVGRSESSRAQQAHTSSVDELRGTVADLSSELTELRKTCEDLQDQLAELKRNLGV